MQVSIFTVAIVILSLIVGNSTSSSNNSNELETLKLALVAMNSKLENLELQLDHKMEMIDNNLSHQLKVSKIRADQVIQKIENF